MQCLCRYYDVTEGNGALAREGERVVVHYEARWNGVHAWSVQALDMGACFLVS